MQHPRILSRQAQTRLRSPTRNAAEHFGPVPTWVQPCSPVRILRAERVLSTSDAIVRKHGRIFL
ncbi:hypothetical protein GF380_05410 [Candidatus Uhrbacteria bacterium]|nr:hypothetical protein [Candidatus Uhrbacteria bacterium]MBD3284468.1 hypothetical protein [Candidatus Uhrbacteria bacterium]